MQPADPENEEDVQELAETYHVIHRHRVLETWLQLSDKGVGCAEFTDLRKQRKRYVKFHKYEIMSFNSSRSQLSSDT